MMKKMVNISEYIVHFNVLNFLKLYFYHLVFYFLGPVVIPIATVLDSFGMVRNMMFWGLGPFARNFWIQYSNWLLIFICGLLTFMKYFEVSLFGYKVTMDGIFYSQYMCLVLVVFIRSFIVAVRYGFSSDLRFEVLRSKRADAPFIIKDLLVPNWLNFSPDNLEVEIDSTFWRN